ncbi:TonB-dependent receptor [Aquabacterium sp. OR-4]|uniref:TonB-dependent receptor n=1 Tax=Aquabacterium sp. OR-4 TaxID=2978127 RepID=UPI0028C8A08D|nr:TonB-dependent receptor [Aquabacterium sp. OR-4]MDT7833994.1 TonB-dependent receptor [Aquabacterium sp. OR-4]
MSRPVPGRARRACHTSAALPALPTMPPALRRNSLSMWVSLCLGGAGAGLAPLALAQPAPAAPAAAAALREHALPAGPLGDLLMRYAAAAGVQLVFDPGLLQGRSSPGLRGRFSLAGGFEQLLRGSGLVLVATPTGYTLRAQPAAPVAQRGVEVAAPAAPERQAAQLDEVYARAARLSDHGGSQQIDGRTLRSFPLVNGDVTSVLKLNPQVQFDNAQLSSLTQGEIAAAEISINGAKPYQNLFLLDGMVLNNDLDPAFARTATNSNHYADVPGAAQGMPLDRNLVCSVEVLDSNVSARHGNFQGGVVQGELCEPRRRELHGRVSYSVAREPWSTLFVDPTRESEFELSDDAAMQPHWRKEALSLSLQGRPHEQLGITAQLGLRRSTIPLRGYVSTQTPNDSTLLSKTQTRENLDALVKFDWRPVAGQQAWLTLRHQPLDDHYFVTNARDSGFDIRGGGQSAAAGWRHALWGMDLTHRLQASEMRQSRRGEVPYFRTWSWSATDKNWGNGTRGTSSTSVEGAWGDVDTEQQTLGYSLQASLQALPPLGGARQQLVWGLDLNQREARYARPRDHHVYLASYRVATSTCTSPLGVVDLENCSLAPSLRHTGTGQYFRSRDVYRAGEFSLRAAQAALWLEDELRWQTVSVRAGLRADRDGLYDQMVLSPRLAATWVLDPAHDTALNAGVNRYHGRSLFNAALREKRETLKLTGQGRNVDWNWTGGTVAKPLNRLDELAVPFDDEAMLGARYGWGPARLSAKWVHRESRRQITRQTVTDTRCSTTNRCYVYNNHGQGSADTLSLELEGRQAALLLAGRHDWSLSISRSQVRSNHADYDDSLTDADSDRLISWRGQIMRFNERPADNFNRPWTGRASLSSYWPAADLRVVHFARWQAGYRQIVQGADVMHEGTSIDAYDERALPSTFSWDMSLTWQPHWGRHRPFVTVTVENLSNRRNLVTSGTWAVYERGRSVSLQLGHEF